MHFKKASKIMSLLFLCGLVLTSSCSRAESNMRRTGEIESVRNSVVAFTLRSPGQAEPQKLNYGAGFFIDDSHVVTALHVARELDKDTKGVGGDLYEIVIGKTAPNEQADFWVTTNLVAKDEENDIAIYKFNPEEIKTQWRDFQIVPLSLADNLPMIGEEVTLTGFYDEYTFPFSSIGTVSMITEDKYKADGETFNRAIFSDLTTLPGHSGGPLYSLQTHTVVGVATRVLNPNKNRARVSIATNSTHVKKLLDKMKRQNAPESNKQPN